MSTPVSSYAITLTGSGAPVTVAAQSFTTEGGILVFFSASSQAVAAFAPGQWTQVEPVVAP